MNPFIKKPSGAEIEWARNIGIEAPDWNFQGYLAKGMVTLLDGHDPHLTECIAVEIAAIQSRSVGNEGLWPDSTQAAQGRVLFITTHRNAEFVLMPLVYAAQPNWSNLHIVRRVHEGRTARVVDMTTDAWDIDGKLQNMGDVSLIVFGPLDPCALKRSGKRDAINRVFAELADLAEKHNAAVLVITRALKKESNYKAARAMINSAWFPSTPVLLLVAAPVEASEEEGQGTRSGVLVSAWSKFGPTQGGFRFNLDAIRIAGNRGREAKALRVTWSEFISGTPKTILDNATRDRNGEESAEGLSQMERAKAFLMDALADGPLRKEVILDMAHEADISESTLERARKVLGIKHAKERGKPHGKFLWSLSKTDWPEDRGYRSMRSEREGEVGGVGQVDKVARFDQVEEVDRVDEVDQVGRGFSMRRSRKDLAERLGDAIRHTEPRYPSGCSDTPFMRAESLLPDLDGTDNPGRSVDMGFMKAESELPDLDNESSGANGSEGGL